MLSALVLNLPFTKGIQKVPCALLIDIFVEMNLDGAGGITQLSFETWDMLLVFGFCHILCSFTTIESTPCEDSIVMNKIERIDWFLYALTLCYLFCFDCGIDYLPHKYKPFSSSKVKSACSSTTSSSTSSNVISPSCSSG